MTQTKSSRTRVAFGASVAFGGGTTRPPRRGSVLIVALGILTVLALLAVSFATVMRTERKATLNYADSVRARFIAEAGIEYAIHELQAIGREKTYTDTTWSGPGPWDSPNDYRRDRWLFGNYTDIGNPDVTLGWDAGGGAAETRWTNLDYEYYETDGVATTLNPPRYPSFVSTQQDGLPNPTDLKLPWDQGALESAPSTLPEYGRPGVPPLAAFRYAASGFVGEIAMIGDSPDTRGNLTARYSKRTARDDAASGWNGDNYVLKVLDTSGQIYLNTDVAHQSQAAGTATWSRDKKLMGEYEPLFSMVYTTARHLLNDLPDTFSAPAGSPLREVLEAMADPAAIEQPHHQLPKAKQLPTGPSTMAGGVTCRSVEAGDETINAAPDGLIRAILDKRFTLPGERFSSKAQLIETDPETLRKTLAEHPLGAPVDGRPYGRLLNPEHYEAIKDFFCVQTSPDEAGVIAQQDPDAFRSWVQTPPYKRTSVANINVNAAPMSVLAGALYGICARTYRYDVDGDDHASFETQATSSYHEPLTGRGVVFPDVFGSYPEETSELYWPTVASTESASSWNDSFQRWGHPETTARRWAAGLPNLPSASQDPDDWDTAPWGPLGYERDGYTSSPNYPAASGGAGGVGYSAWPEDRLALCSKDVGPINYEGAAKIAEALVAYRTKVAPFRTYNELRNFFQFGHGDTTLPTGIDRTFIANVLGNPFDDRILEHLDEYGYSNAYQDRVITQMFIDMLMANFAPYVLSARKNPDAHLAPTIEKGDLIHYTVPFSFGSCGTFEITSLGRVTKLEAQRLDNEVFTVPSIVAKREIRSVVKVFGRVRHASQRDFESFEQQNSSGTSTGASLAWPPLGQDNPPANVEQRRRERRYLVQSWPNVLETYDPGSSSANDSWGFIYPSPVGKWHKGNHGNGWDLAGLGPWGGGGGPRGWVDKFGVEFDWTGRDIIDDAWRDDGTDDFFRNPGMSTAFFAGMHEDIGASGAANEDLDNMDFCLFMDPVPPYQPYTGPLIGGFEDLMTPSRSDRWRISQDVDDVEIGGSFLGGSSQAWNPLMINWFDWSEEMNRAAIPEYTHYRDDPAQLPGETRQSFAHIDVSTSVLSSGYALRDRSNANPDGYFSDFQRRGSLIYWASNPLVGGSTASRARLGFQFHQEAAQGTGQSPNDGSPNDILSEDVHQNLSFRDGGIEFWAKLDVRGSDPVPCGFFSSIQVTNMDEDRAPTSGTPAPPPSSPYAEDANGQPTGGVAMYVFKDAFGFLRISRIAFEKAFIVPEFESSPITSNFCLQTAPPGGTQPMPLAATDYEDIAALPAEWNEFEPHNEFGSIGHADGWNFWPRCDVIYDIGDWGAHEWHHVAIGWHAGTVLYEASGTPDSSWETIGNPLLWIDGVQCGSPSNVYAFGGQGPAVVGAGSNAAWQEEADGAAPDPASGAFDPAMNVVHYSMLNVVGPFDHMVVGSVLRRQYRGEDGVFRFYTDGVCANLWGTTDYAVWDGYSSQLVGNPYSIGDAGGQRVGQDPWYRDRGHTVVLPANGTIDSFHTYPDWSQFENPVNEDPGRYDEYYYDDLLASPPPPARTWRTGGQDIYPEFVGCFQFPDLDFPKGVTLGALSWTEIRPVEMRFSADPANARKSETESDMVTVSPLLEDDLLHGEGCREESNACGLGWNPDIWPDLHMAWAAQFIDVQSQSYPSTSVEDGFDTNWKWVEADPGRLGDADGAQDQFFATYPGAGAQSGIGGPLREDPAGANVKFNGGDRLYYRAIFSSFTDWDSVAGTRARLLSMAALVDVTITYLQDPEILIWEERID